METANKIYLRRTFNCSAFELFEWLTKPDLIAQWFGPKHLTVGNIEIDFRLGGHYSIELIKPDQSSISIEGKYLEIEIPNKLVFSFLYKGLHSNPPESVVKISVKSVSNNESQLSLVQDFISKPSDLDNRISSWEHMFYVLDALLKL